MTEKCHDRDYASFRTTRHFTKSYSRFGEILSFLRIKNLQQWRLLINLRSRRYEFFAYDNDHDLRVFRDNTD